MKAFNKFWIAPVFGSLFFWAVSMIAAPGGESVSGQRLSAIAAKQASPIKKSLTRAKNDQDAAIRGRVSKFKEREVLVVDDGSEEIQIEWQNKYMPLNLKVGDLVSVKGDFSPNRQNQNQLIAEEIYQGTKKVYPQKDSSTHLHDKTAMTRYEDEDTTSPDYRVSRTKTADAAAFTIADIKTSTVGDTVMVEGTIIDLPEEEVLLLQDSSGEVFVEIADARSFLNLRKGDKVKVQARVNKGSAGENELEAIRIEKK